VSLSKFSYHNLDMGLGNLIKCVRTINVYKQTRGKRLGELVEEFNIDAVSIVLLKTIITANNDDPLLYDGYPLNKKQLKRINDLLKNKIVFDYEKFDYVLECYGIYDNIN